MATATGIPSPPGPPATAAQLCPPATTATTRTPRSTPRGQRHQDGDGGNELVIGARQESEGGVNAGAVFLVSGSTRGVVDTSDHLSKIVGTVGALLGQRVGNAGDLDGDGAEDLWISGTGYDGYEGAVFVMSITEL